MSVECISCAALYQLEIVQLVFVCLDFGKKKMGKHRFKTIRLFLKLVLIFQICSHHCFKAEATENKCRGSFNEGKASEEPESD